MQGRKLREQIRYFISEYFYPGNTSHALRFETKILIQDRAKAILNARKTTYWHMDTKK